MTDDELIEGLKIFEARDDELSIARCSYHCGVAWLNVDECDNALDGFIDAQVIYASRGWKLSLPVFGPM